MKMTPAKTKVIFKELENKEAEQIEWLFRAKKKNHAGKGKLNSGNKEAIKTIVGSLWKSQLYNEK